MVKKLNALIEKQRKQSDKATAKPLFLNKVQIYTAER